MAIMYRGKRVFKGTTTIPSGSTLDVSGSTGTITFAAGEIAAADIASSAVIEAKIGALAVTEGKIGSSAVTAGKIGANAVTKAKLNSEVYYIEPVTLASGVWDNKTIKAYRCWSACTLVRVCYWTSQALGTSLGIDVVDGGTDGSGSDVIDSCDDDLNGSDVNTLTTPYALSAGDYINLVVDDITDSTNINVIVLLKVPLTSAT